MNGLEKELAGDVEFVRLNLMSTLGKQIAQQYGVTAARTTILLDGSGKVVYNHSGLPERKKIMALLGKG